MENSRQKNMSIRRFVNDEGEEGSTPDAHRPDSNLELNRADLGSIVAGDRRGQRKESDFVQVLGKVSVGDRPLKEAHCVVECGTSDDVARWTRLDQSVL